MSAFIVGRNTISDIVSLACGEVERRRAQQPICVITEDPDAFGESLMRMNHEAVVYRYNLLDQKTEFPYRHTRRDVTMEQAFRSCNCWLYQCAEGERFIESCLYKQVEMIRNMVAIEIAEKHSQDCYWGD